MEKRIKIWKFCNRKISLCAGNLHMPKLERHDKPGAYVESIRQRDRQQHKFVLQDHYLLLYRMITLFKLNQRTSLFPAKPLFMCWT